ncbi:MULTISPECIES: site-specific integrase [unclassified Oceanispirochaeta]|uniref:tyrosine-type recombinase/integrase n=1 Tax=unclassified Oceanispirochaeta TaxID=2635722 RepID=UPI000E0909FC|nr:MULTISPECIES: site-specific integrase [unclassified Oceanispirochaeta]MBF9018959.1 site-specific integrase [Oceanispirochaeta sp. M2]NPD75449.1 site-specific integrase [Oceanispirochaeta sp. M1]RDG28699.1 site-specific integrase [Oceanispirochaeta sp. M1]
MNTTLIRVEDKKSIEEAMKVWSWKSYSYKHLRPFNDYLALTDNEDIEKTLRGYFEALNSAFKNNQRSASSVRIDRTAVKQFIRTEIKKTNGGAFNPQLKLQLETMLKDIDSDIKCPVKKKQPVKDQKIITHEEYRILLEDCTDSRIEALARFLFNTGIRISEALSIRLRGAYMSDESVSFSVVGKGNSERDIICDRKVWERAAEVFQGKTWLFENTRSNKPYDPVYLTQLIRRYSEKKIGRTVTAHVFRHYFATTQIEKGMPIHTLSKLLGHSSVDITAQYYLHDVPPEGYWREE